MLTLNKSNKTNVMLCYFMLYHPLFDVSPLRVMLCYAMLCYAMLSYANLWYHKKHYITKTCASRDERSESREALISQKHGITKTLYHKHLISQNIVSLQKQFLGSTLGNNYFVKYVLHMVNLSITH